MWYNNNAVFLGGIKTFYSIKNGKLSEIDTNNLTDSESQSHIGVISYDEIYSTADTIGIDNNKNAFSNHTPRFESHEGYDFFCLKFLSKEDLMMPSKTIYIYLKTNLFLFICEDVAWVDEIIHAIMDENLSDLNFGRLLCRFFDRITDNEIYLHDKIEAELSVLEENLLITKKRDFVNVIISIRKKLMVLKTYYEHLIDIFDELEENENNILDEYSLRILKIISNKIDRLFHNVLNLREYSTTVREAYQAEVDIQLNSTMKLFTVVTTIFLPLTLIVGWYGMNFKMPEYEWVFGYHLVIIVSIVIVGLLIMFFKKNKWF